MKSLPRYPWDQSVEAAAATLSCSDPVFYRVVGHAVDPRRLTYPAAALAVRAAHRIFKAKGAPPESLLETLVHLFGEMRGGSVTHRMVASVNDLFDATLDHGLPDSAALSREVADHLRFAAVQYVARQR